MLIAEDSPPITGMRSSFRFLWPVDCSRHLSLALLCRLLCSAARGDLARGWAKGIKTEISPSGPRTAARRGDLRAEELRAELRWSPAKCLTRTLREPTDHVVLLGAATLLFHGRTVVFSRSSGLSSRRRRERPATSAPTTPGSGGPRWAELAVASTEPEAVGDHSPPLPLPCDTRAESPQTPCVRHSSVCRTGLPSRGGRGARAPGRAEPARPPLPPSAPWGPSSRGQSGPRGEPRRSQLEKNFKPQADQAQSRPTRRRRGGRRLSKRRTAAPGSRTTLDADADTEDGRLAARCGEPRGRGRHTARVHTLSLPPAAWATSGPRPRVLSGKSRVPIMRLSGPR